MLAENPRSDNRVKLDVGFALARQAAQRVIDSKSEVNPYVPHTPHPGPQSEFLGLGNREAFYGGAAGGGKSDALLMGALEYVHLPNYAALILRRTFADLALPDAIMSRAEQWLIGTKAKWNGQEKTWTFPSGATLTFGYLENEKDKYRYQGSAFQFIGFDELTQFTETQYLYLFSRLRRLEGSPIPPRMRSASNPGGEGHDWVKARFVLSDDASRVFIPARLSDNPSLDQEDYIESLKELDPVTLAQLLSGDWDVLPTGNIFHRDYFRTIHQRPPLLFWIRYFDLAVSLKQEADFTASAMVGVRASGAIVVADVTEWKREWPDTRDGIRDEQGRTINPGIIEIAKADYDRIESEYRQECEADPLNAPTHKPRYMLGVEAQAQQLGFVQDLHRNDLFLRIPLHGIPAKGDKKERASTWAARGANSGIEIVEGPWNSKFMSQCLSFDGKGILKDDMVDAVSGAIELLYRHRGGENEERDKLPAQGSRAYYKELARQAR